MPVEVKIIEDSYSDTAGRVTTIQLRYQRFIHAEFMTHRMFSRNASSSRAIPVSKMIESILEDTAMPSSWGRNQPGMQAGEDWDALLTGSGVGVYNSFDNEYSSITKIEAWNKARDNAITFARAFHNAEYHKQIVNRLLEPFSYISVVCTASDYANFFYLRSHKDAQPEIKVLSDMMRDALSASTPRYLAPGDWHLPYVTDEERHAVDFYSMGHGNVGEEPRHTAAELIKMSVARCARVSYLTHDGKVPSADADFALFDRLVGSEPLHASPAEHQATPAQAGQRLGGNLGNQWVQFRKTLPGEFRGGDPHAYAHV